MKISVESIKVAERIRKQTTKIEELAADIQKNGLINPITVMLTGEEYQLLAGLRRLRAVELLGWTEVEVNAVSAKDAEEALNVEYSENVQREAFTFSEKMDYARMIDKIEKAKAQERKVIGGETAGRSRPQKDGAQGPQPIAQRDPRARDIVGSKIGLSGRQYERARYIAGHAPQEVIDKLDQGERTIRSTYDELRALEKKSPSETAPFVAASTGVKSSPEKAKQPIAAPSDAPPIQKPLPETDLQRAIRAESELDAFKYRQHNEIYHRDSIIDHLKRRVSELEDALEAANARIRELEDIIQCRS